MSSSYRKPASLRIAFSCTCVIAGAVTLPLTACLAAQTYVEPRAAVRVENNDNFNLTPGGSTTGNDYGYIADLQALVGIATPRSDTSIRPRIRVQEYPDRSELEKFEAFLVGRWLYKWERSNLLVTGNYDRQDSYNVDQPGGQFDPLDPGNPANADSGETVIGEVRNLFEIHPNYTYDVTERTRLGVEADYRAVRFDAGKGGTPHVDYDYMIGQGRVNWALNPRSDFSAGAFVSKYEAKDNSTNTDAYGGGVGYVYRWSETVGAEVNIYYEQDDTTDYQPAPAKLSTSGWGGTVTGYSEGEVSSWRFTVGRTFIPTGDGGKADSDQIRVQYDRDLSERLIFNGAARYEARNAFSGTGSDSDRDYARADLSLKWMMAPTWYLQGGYTYIWQHLASADGSADNNKVWVSVGYQGRGRRRH